MRTRIGEHGAREMLFVLVAAICLSFSDSPALALTKDEMMAYHDDVKNIVKESMLQLTPGTLKKAPLSQEEEQRRTRELMKIVGDTSNKKWANDALTYYSAFFRKCAERLAREVVVVDHDLAAWHKKLFAGYQDSYEVTMLALGLIETPDMTGLNEALLKNEDLKKRIRDNQTYHHGIQTELDKIIKSYFPSDMKLQRYSRDLTGIYVETTWK